MAANSTYYAEKTDQVSRHPVSIVGCGTAGSRLLARLAPCDEAQLIAVDWLAGQAAAPPGGIEQVDLGSRPAFLCGGDPIPHKRTLTRSATEDSFDAIAGAIGQTVSVILVAGIGGGTGAALLQQLALALAISGASVQTVIATPFLFEGPRRSQHADTVLERLKSAGIPGEIVEGKSLDCTGLKLADALQWMDNQMVLAIRRMLPLPLEGRP